ENTVSSMLPTFLLFCIVLTLIFRKDAILRTPQPKSFIRGKTDREFRACIHCKYSLIADKFYRIFTCIFEFHSVVFLLFCKLNYNVYISYYCIPMIDLEKVADILMHIIKNFHFNAF